MARHRRENIANDSNHISQAAMWHNLWRRRKGEKMASQAASEMWRSGVAHRQRNQWRRHGNGVMAMTANVVSVKKHTTAWQWQPAAAAAMAAVTIRRQWRDHM